MEAGGETEEPEAAWEQQRGAEQRDRDQQLHAGLARHPGAHSDPGPGVEAPLQHGLQLHVSLHTTAKLNG